MMISNSVTAEPVQRDRSGTAAAVLEPRPSPAVAGYAASFDEVYRAADGDSARVPWADERANPALVSWLNAEAPGRIRPGARAVVVGAGLGDDVVELLGRGYDATGFDVSPAAVEWSRRRFPEHAENFVVADLLAPPARMRRRFDLVVDAYTIQSLPIALRADAAAAIASLCCPRGTAVCIARGRDDGQPLDSFKGPPWPLSARELVSLFESAGMHPVREADDFLDDETPPVRRLRAAFVHR
ncbi:MAG: class I SAM-dependent methyltransferase [Phycisphaeraceae bacterium]|nr:class I SAM-dependent methyltransferase [Phycisphaeraceae bacterium]MBX3405209.1 class I SAM-dependent methyltransferase [Phycisphaeraceae bacterium]